MNQSEQSTLTNESDGRPQAASEEVLDFEQALAKVGGFGRS